VFAVATLGATKFVCVRAIVNVTGVLIGAAIVGVTTSEALYDPLFNASN
jgi:hypothetical protein